MSWAGLTANQIVSIGNLLDAVSNSVFLTGPSGYTGATSREVLKRDASNYAMISTIYAPFLAKSDNQLVIKSDLIAATGSPGATVTLITVTNASTSVPVTNVLVNGVAVTHVLGTNFPIASGANGLFSTTQCGTHDIEVDYGSNIGGESLTIVDSAPAFQCFNLSFSGGTVNKTGSTITVGVGMNVDLSDGVCA